ncbi:MULTISPECIES: hypothetical protein [unclassified Paracoccus (in: a-proteobacteria)]|uniref:hypothetical protein n=1 Tax=unclassified Paracoccus (in: a-proteobacteria) TaxID=2688777 RepID=UPI001603A031|nr:MULTISPECIES: hypothetical protein [unclassified Paracoccus (in: a-proteobacteria)]MBB1490309.1 hypothetical protein [Paracoccus sp. MC1854]MBB1498767.1 hypothetical protein [Paracoccus sp. MC1862]QQO43927.1 hypothetical protein JGR78_10900 [Paracoccus sp. MC1862]
MMGAVLQLERFDREPVEPLPAVFAQTDLDAAFARGLDEGRGLTEARQVAALCDAVDGLSRRLDAEQAARGAAGASDVRRIAPLIEALLDAVVPAVARARLQGALLEEMLKLSSAVPSLTARIRCGPDLAAFAAACLSATGAAGIEIDPTAPEGTAEVELLGGRIAWDMAQIAAELRKLVNEVTEVE